MKPISFQLYSVRDALAQDFDGTMKYVAGLGFQGVEVFGNLRSAKETKALADSLGLKVSGRHVPFDPLLQDLQAQIDYTLELGTQYLVCAWSKADEKHSWPQIADELARMAATSKDQGVKFVYHNHGHELSESVNGTRVMDLILSKPNVWAELDIAWVYAGGVDPVAYVKQYNPQTPLLHVKDASQKADGGWDTVNFGTGKVPLKACIDAATAAEWLVVEQDHSPDPLASAKHNIETLKTLL